MGIFSTTTPFDQIVEKATHETNTKEDWALILDICDKIGASQQHAKDCLKSIIRRLNHPDPHVELQAITLLDACVSNCGLNFHLEIASRDFEQEFRKILHKTQEKTIRDKLLGCLEKWALNEFKTDPQLNLIPSMYNKLKHAGAEFPSQADGSPSKSKKHGHGHGHKSKSHSSSSGGGSSSSGTNSAAAREEEDLAKAIELSLKETQQQQTSKSLYPQAALSSGPGHSSGGSTLNNSSTAAAATANHEARKVRALYDFEAAEDNELTFFAGEIVHVLDDTDPNWWEGSNQRGQGLFPANFVTADLSAEPQESLVNKKSVQFKDEVVVKTVESEPEQVEIDEAKIDNALHVLHEADPTGVTPDPPELAILEDQVQQMGPLIDQELEKVDRRHAQLTILGKELVDALNLYHQLMRDPGLNAQPPSSMPYAPRMGLPPNMPGYGGMPPNSMQQVPPVSYPGYYPAPPGAVGPYSLPQQGPGGMGPQAGQPPQSMPQQSPHQYGSPMTMPTQVHGQLPQEYANHGQPMPNHMHQPQHNMYGQGGPMPQENGVPHQHQQQQQPGPGIQSPPASHHQMIQAPASNSGYQL